MKTRNLNFNFILGIPLTQIQRLGDTVCGVVLLLK